jgi:hypothetical protein
MDISTEELEKRVESWKQGYWEIPDNLDTTGFDFDWKPAPQDKPYIHQFGTQWQKTGGPRFVIPNHEGIKYQSFQHAIRKPNTDDRSWRPLVADATIDFSWHPDDTDPPLIYVFGNQWYDAEIMPTYQYRVTGATEKKYVNVLKAQLQPNKTNWEIPEDIEDDFDYSWVPNPHEPLFIWQFGTQWQKTGGPRYIPSATSTIVKYIDVQKAIKKSDPEKRNWRPLKAGIEFDWSWHPDPDEPPFIYVFGNQWHSAEKMPTLLYRVEGATEKKYINDVFAILPQQKENFKALIDLDFGFDYSWCPDPGDPPYTYVFGNQWYTGEVMPTLMYVTEKSIATKYIDDAWAVLFPNKTKWEIPDDIKDDFDYSWVPNPHEPPYIYQFGTQWQKTGGPKYKTEGAIDIKFVDIIKAAKQPNMRNWRIIEPIIADTFDFSWHPDETDGNYSYVFGNKFHTPEIMPTVMYKGKSATDNKYSDEMTADIKIETIEYTDSIFDRFMEVDFDSAYARFTNNNAPMDFSVLKQDKLNVHVFNNEAIIPREAKTHLYDNIMDYPYIDHRNQVNNARPLDIIFLSNGEEIADENYEHLLSITKDIPNRVIRVDGVKGRVDSQHAAANASETAWYFLVNGKLRVNEKFDFSWQPNIYQSSRHYVFRATNPVNGLEYGHQAIVANNKRLTLNTVVRGLDFTMDSKTEVLDINSGVGMYNTSVWDTWRTAFREVLKLKYYTEHNEDADSAARLHIWLTVGTGEYSEHSIKGANDAVAYYDSVEGKLESLMLSYDWEWLKKHFDSLN